MKKQTTETITTNAPVAAFRYAPRVLSAPASRLRALVGCDGVSPIDALRCAWLATSPAGVVAIRAAEAIWDRAYNTGLDKRKYLDEQEQREKA